MPSNDFAHGVSVASESANFAHDCTDLYSPGSGFPVLCREPDIDPGRPAAETGFFPKYSAARRLKDMDRESRPVYSLPAP